MRSRLRACIHGGTVGDCNRYHLTGCSTSRLWVGTTPSSGGAEAHGAPAMRGSDACNVLARKLCAPAWRGARDWRREDSDPLSSLLGSNNLAVVRLVPPSLPYVLPLIPPWRSPRPVADREDAAETRVKPSFHPLPWALCADGPWPAVFMALAPDPSAGSPWWLYAGGAVGALPSSRSSLSRDRSRAAVLAALAAIILYEVAGFLTVPRLRSFGSRPRLPKRCSATLERRSSGGHGRLCRTSIRFLLGTRTELALGPEAGATAAKVEALLVNEMNAQGFSMLLPTPARANKPARRHRRT
jgi:hypothetical protein